MTKLPVNFSEEHAAENLKDLRKRKGITILELVSDTNLGKAAIIQSGAKKMTLHLALSQFVINNVLQRFILSGKGFEYQHVNINHA